MLFEQNDFVLCLVGFEFTFLLNLFEIGISLTKFFDEIVNFNLELMVLFIEFSVSLIYSLKFILGAKHESAHILKTKFLL